MALSLRAVVVPESKLFESPLKYVAGAFYKCRNLKKVSHRVFENCIESRSFSHTFDGCNLTSIDAYWFRNSKLLENIKAIFQGYKGKNIPKNLFIFNSKLSNIDRAFDNSFNIENIPSELFRYNNIRSANATFKNCFSLTTIPQGLFNNSYNTLSDINWIFAIVDEDKVRQGFLGIKELPIISFNNIIPFWNYPKVKKDDNYRPYQNAINSEIPEGWS